MKFLADENFPRPALLVLRTAGRDVRSVAEDSPGLSDEEVAECCEREQRVLLTFDKDFGDLVFRRGLQAGSAIVLFRLVPASPEEVSSILRSLLATDALVAGSFCVVTRDKVRTRPLHQQNKAKYDAALPRNHQT